VSLQTSNSFSFRWRSRLGITVGLFLLWGALNVFAAIFTPLSLHRNGAGAVGALVLTPEADAALVGRPLVELAQADPKLNAFLVSFMDTMCAQMMAYAIVHLAVVWFALRRGQMWALWAAATGAVVSFVYFVPIVREYARFGVPAGGGFMLGVAIALVIILAATATGWFGLRQTSGRVRNSMNVSRKD
jgi:hypothetical protein